MIHPEPKCDEWDEACEKIDGIFVIAKVHGVDYTGPQYKYCPFCGAKGNEGQTVSIVEITD